MESIGKHVIVTLELGTVPVLVLEFANSIVRGGAHCDHVPGICSAIAGRPTGLYCTILWAALAGRYGYLYVLHQPWTGNNMAAIIAEIRGS